MLKVKCKSGVIGWRGRLRKNYDSFADFNHYSSTYGLHKRLGYATAQKAWDANPIVEGSVNPDDFRRVPKARLKYKQYAIVHFDNCGPTVELFRSHKPITIEKVAAFLTKTEGFDEGRDSLTFVDAPVKQPPLR